MPGSKHTRGALTYEEVGRKSFDKVGKLIAYRVTMGGYCQGYRVRTEQTTPPIHRGAGYNVTFAREIKVNGDVDREGNFIGWSKAIRKLTCLKKMKQQIAERQPIFHRQKHTGAKARKKRRIVNSRNAPR